MGVGSLTLNPSAALPWRFGNLAVKIVMVLPKKRRLSGKIMRTRSERGLALGTGDLFSRTAKIGLNLL